MRRIILLTLCFLTPVLSNFAAENLGILGSHPRWSVLEHYQETITHDEFAHLIYDVYCTHGFAPDLFELRSDTARILINRESQEFLTLHFAKNNRQRKAVPRLWHPAKSLPAAKADKPLAGLRIALDPGHLGGEWGRREERWFKVVTTELVEEGDLTLKVARLLAPHLRELGAKVFFVRKSNEPVTAKRPDDFRELARKILIKNGVAEPRAEALKSNDPQKEQTIRWQSEILFYRYSEIRRRAARVNFQLHPDVVLC